MEPDVSEKVMALSQQLALPLRLNESRSLKNFVAGPNAETVALIESLCRPKAGGADAALFLWGQEGTGRSHLLQALCHSRSASGAAVMYLPLDEFKEHPAEILEGCAELDLVCLDDVDAICGNDDWERGVFHLFNELKDRGGQLVVTAQVNPRNLECHLPDLSSRLAWGLVMHVQPLDEAQRVEALRLRAQGLGMRLDRDAGEYLLRHWRRDLKALFELLEHLDVASLQAQRRLTRVFVREVLQSLSVEADEVEAAD